MATSPKFESSADAQLGQYRSPEYAELLCTSNFSFLKGASHPEELVEQAHGLGYKALAITDECSLAGIVRAHQAAQACGLHLIVGAQFVFSQGSEFAGQRLALLVKNQGGYTHLCRLITQARRRSEKGDYQFLKEDLADCPPGLWILLCPNPVMSASHFTELLHWCVARFTGRVGMVCSMLHTGFDATWLLQLKALASMHQVPILAAQDVLMHAAERKPLLDVLTAIRLNQNLNEARHSLQPNAERCLKPRHQLEALYPPELLANTVQWAKACQFSLNSLKYQYPDEVSPNGQNPMQVLTELAWQGAAQRYGDLRHVPLPVQQQIQYELQLIGQLNYAAYFLTVYDLVRFARSRGILCQGRGSAANSTVCFCIGITEVNPARTEVLFERFISKERNEPPDIDVDFEHSRREEVIQYIYQKYGRHRAALAASVVVYRPRSAIRDAGKALGLETTLLETMAKSQDGMYARLIRPEYMTQAGVELDQPEVNRCLHFAEQLLGFPRHLSQHTGGFVIAKGPLHELVPVENASMPDRSVIQWDKDDLDAMGLMKVDVLALGMLSAIRMTFDALQRKPGTPRTMAHIPDGDEATYRMISQADTIGVFQVESRAQMGMLPRLKPNCYYDLVIQVAIVRPGPIQGGMVHPYLQRRQGLEPVNFPSQALEKALGRTLGVPIFQEQVMQIAILAAGFSPGEADQLRRGMAAWRRKGGLHQFYERVVGGMVSRGYERQFAESIFKQIEGFGEYGFPESHAASFALLVYVSAWLKCHHPDAFLCGLLNAQPMGFYQPAQLIQDAQRHGVSVLPVDVQHSGLLCELEPLTLSDGMEATKAGRQPVRLGLNLVMQLSQQAAQSIVQARADGPFLSTEDLAKRAQLDRKALLALADANALQSLAGHRREAVWSTAGLDTQRDLLSQTRTEEPQIALAKPSDLEDMLADYRALQASLKHHPIQFLRPRLNGQLIKPIAELKTYPDGRLARACGVVTHRQRPATAKGTVFLTLEDETGHVNIIVWGEMAEQNRSILRGAQIMGVFGVWQRQGEVCNLLAKRLVDYTPLLAELRSKSRDFH